MPEDATFFSKDDVECPICRTLFKREELRMGGGRLNAGELTNELRRKYIPTQKYGKVNPLLYPLTVCPNCLYAADDYDFLSVPQKAIDRIMQYKDIRAEYLLRIFGKIPDFTAKRDIISGISSYILAMNCYPFFDKKNFSPTIKIGIYSLRSAWLFNDLFEETKNQDYSELSMIFYRKAAEFYDTAITNQTRAIEPLDGAKNLGPDTDKNYGYDGVLYINSVLKYKTLLFIEDPYEKVKKLEEIKRILSKVFGIGKKTKNKPEVLLNFAKEIYERVTEDFENLKNFLSEEQREEIVKQEKEDESEDEE
ncbi:MAG: DUF2225 domain-containing protein [Brevinematia bacterium]